MLTDGQAIALMQVIGTIVVALLTLIGVIAAAVINGRVSRTKGSLIELASQVVTLSDRLTETERKYTRALKEIIAWRKWADEVITVLRGLKDGHTIEANLPPRPQVTVYTKSHTGTRTEEEGEL